MSEHRRPDGGSETGPDTEPDTGPDAGPPGADGWYIAADGWVSVPGPDGQTSLRVRIQPGAGGRFVVTDMLLSGPKLTADVLRQVQLSRIDAVVNLYADTLEARTGADRAYVTAGSGDLGRLLAVDALTAGRADDGLTLGELRARVPQVPPEQARTPLPRPDGTDPDGFYRQVADAYRSLTPRTSRPAVVIAEEAGVPRTTVHRWIYEARRRGFLPPAEKGKAG